MLTPISLITLQPSLHCLVFSYINTTSCDQAPNPVPKKTIRKRSQFQLRQNVACVGSGGEGNSTAQLTQLTFRIQMTQLTQLAYCVSTGQLCQLCQLWPFVETVPLCGRNEKGLLIRSSWGRLGCCSVFFLIWQCTVWCNTKLIHFTWGIFLKL